MTVLGQLKEKLEGRNLWYKPLYPNTTDSKDEFKKETTEIHRALQRDNGKLVVRSRPRDRQRVRITWCKGKV